jgi:hypothetical protein
MCYNNPKFSENENAAIRGGIKEQFSGKVVDSDFVAW